MQPHPRHSSDRSAEIVEGLRAACLTATVIALGVLVAGCGGNSPSGGVASLGSHVSKSSRTSATAAGSSGGPSSSGSPGSQAVAYSACMGRTEFPTSPIQRSPPAATG